MDQDQIQNLNNVLAAQQRAKQTSRLESMEQELRALRKAVKEEGAKPQCPACGGRIDRDFRKCKHCGSDLIWLEGIPGEPGKEGDLQEKVDAIKRKVAAEIEEEQRRRSLPQCPRCGAPSDKPFLISCRRGIQGVDGSVWVPWFSFSHRESCERCAQRDERLFAENAWALGIAITLCVVVGGCMVALSN